MNKKTYFMNLGLVWIFAPVLIGLSMHIGPIFGFIVWFGVPIALVLVNMILLKSGDSSSGGTEDREL